MLINYKRNATIISVAQMSCDKSKKFEIHFKKSVDNKFDR